MTGVMIQQVNMFVAATSYGNHDSSDDATTIIKNVNTAPVTDATEYATEVTSSGGGGSGLERGGGERGFISGMRERQDSGRRRSLLARLRRRLSRGVSGSSDTEYGFTTQTQSTNAAVGDQPNNSLISSVSTTTNETLLNNDTDSDAGESLIRRKSFGARKVSDVFRRRFYTSGQTELSRANKTKQNQEQHLAALQQQAAETLGGSQSGLRRAQSDSSLQKNNNVAVQICSVCSKQPAVDPKTGFRLKSFGGQVCVDCFRQHVQQKVLAGEAYHMTAPPTVMPKTPADAANAYNAISVDVHEIEQYCEPEILDRYLLINTVKRGENYPNYVLCCTPGCGSRVPISQASLMDQQQVRFYTKCLRCSAQYCPKCKIPKHIHLKTTDCGAARAIYERHLKNASLKTKYCPKCGHANDKAESAQIECAHCHYKYCWFCTHDLTNDEYLLHFTEGTCKGRLGTKQPDITAHHLESTFLLAGVGLVMLASTPLLLVGMPVYVAAKKGRKAWKKRQQMRRWESVGESATDDGSHANVMESNGTDVLIGSRLPQSADEHRKSVAAPASVAEELIREEPESEQIISIEEHKIVK